MKRFIVLLLGLLSSWGAWAQSTCSCDLTITQSGYYDIKKLKTPVLPGQRICIKGGTYQYLTLVNVVGAPNRPITIMNCNGVATFSNDNGYGGIDFRNSAYVRLTGVNTDGSSGSRYGFVIQKVPSGRSAVHIEEKSTDFEVDHIEVAGSGFAGIVVKTDPSCDPSTWRNNLIVSNISLHDNYIHDVPGEGIYVGNSFWNEGMVRTCDGAQKTVFPHNIYGLRIFNNLTERTGAEGIQYGCSPDAQVYNNIVRDAGRSPFAAYQDNGIQVGGGSGGSLYGNVIQNSPSSGIILVGHLGNNIICNNVVHNAGGYGITVINKPNTDFYTSVNIINNTVLNTGNHSIKLWNDKNFLTWVANNILLNPTTRKYIDIDQNLKPNQVNLADNWTSPSVEAARLTDINAGNYTPASGSPLIDAGISVGGWGIRTDLLKNARLMGKATDVGAVESPVRGAGRQAVQEAATAGQPDSDATTTTAYPSPCVDQLTIRIPEGRPIKEVEVYDVQGLVVRQSGAVAVDNVSFDVRTLTPGWYVYRVTDTNNQVYNGRFIKQ